MGLFQRPGWVIFIDGEYKAGIRRVIIEELLDTDLIPQIAGDQIAHLLYGFLLCLTKSQTTVDEYRESIRDGVDGCCADAGIGHHEGTFPQERIGMQVRVQIANT